MRPSDQIFVHLRKLIDGIAPRVCLWHRLWGSDVIDRDT